MVLQTVQFWSLLGSVTKAEAPELLMKRAVFRPMPTVEALLESFNWSPTASVNDPVVLSTMLPLALTP